MIIKQIKPLVVLVGLCCLCFMGHAQNGPKYGIASSPWPEGLGNHRAVLDIEKPSDAVRLQLEWRRHDVNVSKRRFLIINGQTGDTVPNIHRIAVNREACDLVFGPVAKGTYYFYYLPFKPDHEHGQYRYGYLPKEPLPNRDWMANNILGRPKSLKKLPQAQCNLIEARKAFDSFYPMEVIATKTETTAFLKEHPGDYLAVPEDRTHPIKMREDLPQRWMSLKKLNEFSATVLKNEYYPLQIGIYAAKKDIKNIKIQFEDLVSPTGNKLSRNLLTCFNTDGVNPYGKAFTKQVDVAQGKVQPLWIGIDIPRDAVADDYLGILTITVEDQPDKRIKLHLKIGDRTLADRGDGELWRYSRLRWLNSTLGIDDDPVAPYGPISVSPSGSIGLSGKDIELTNTGLPTSLKVYGREILAAPMRYRLSEEIPSEGEKKGMELKTGKLDESWLAESRDFKISTTVSIEDDGFLHYGIKLRAKKAIYLPNFSLEIPLKPDIAEYMMGMGLPGTSVPEKHQAKWEGPHDSFWVGNTHGGLHVELRGTGYHGPLLNLYKPAPPVSWDNDGKGGFSIEKMSGKTLATVFTGPRKFGEGEEITFEFALLLTPVKHIGTKQQFTQRYYHNGANPWPNENEVASGVKIINVHHANKYNPYINYPFIATKELKSFVNHWHQEGLKVKIYYTIRELTDRVAELWVLRSLGNEILAGGKGGGYPWLQEHFVTDYTPQWYAPMEGDIDASVLTAPGDSRWFNYYIEGLSWLVKNMDLDGLYLDDVSYDRRIVKRMRKVMDRAKPGCIMDLHSNTGFSKGPATQYTDFFPYTNKLWFGESFKYDEMPPENWLVEVSGIPFGLMGDMLHAGGNPWRGMVYGMTVRYPWYTEGVTCDPREIWKVWDSFGIADAKMIGYWEDHPPIICPNPNIKVTSYIRDGKVLIAMASWAKQEVEVKLNIDIKALGLARKKLHLYAPTISGFQQGRTFKLTDKIPVAPKKGWLLVLE